MTPLSLRFLALYFTAEAHLPDGYQVEWGSQFEYLKRACHRLSIIFADYDCYRLCTPFFFVWLSSPCWLGIVVVALLGMVPAARTTGIGSDVQQPLATVLGGLLSTLLLTLIALPSMYDLITWEKGEQRHDGSDEVITDFR